MASTHSSVRSTVLVEFDHEEFTRLEASPAPKHPYKALPSKGDHIRLIKLFPGKFNERIEIKIETVEFDRFDTPPYFALSYTWNDSHHDSLIIAGRRISMCDPLRLKYDIRHPIWCGDQRLLITTNLRDALRRLRHATQPQTFWIDALCINQDDLDERASQVLIMQRIYHTAAVVKLWLGEASDGADQAFDLLRRLAEVSNERAARQSIKDLYRKDYLESLQLPPFPSSAWRMVIDMLDRPVFVRIWIVQELVAALKVMVHCGPCKPISFVMLANAVNLLGRTGWLPEVRRVFRVSLPGKPYVHSIAAITYVYIMWIQEPTTVELRHERRRALVSVTRRFLASDPRDKVFALISLINDYGHRELHGEDCPDGMLRDRHKTRILPGIQAVIDFQQDLVAASILQKTTDSALVAVGNTLIAYLDFALKVLPIFQSPSPQTDPQRQYRALAATWKELGDGLTYFVRQQRTLDGDNHIVQQFLGRLYPKIISRVDTFFDLLGSTNATLLMAFDNDDDYHKDIRQLEFLITETRRSLTDPSVIPENLSRDFGVVGPVVSSKDLRQTGEGGVPISSAVRNDDESEKRDWAWTPKGLRVPDYRLAVEDIYTEFTVKCMRDDRNLDMLLGIEDRSERVHTALPSWVPDLGVAPSGAGLRRWRPGSGHKTYRASGNEPVDVHWDPAAPQVLVVDGYKFDVIESLAGKDALGGKFGANRPMWKALITHLPKHYPCVGGNPNNQRKGQVLLREAFWRTMIGDGVHDASGFVTPAPDEYGRYYEILNVQADCTDNVRAAPAIMLRKVIKGLVTVDDLKRRTEIEAMIMPLVEEVTLNRRLGVTRHGFLGVMPPAAQEGDLIYLLKGGAVPFVLRPLAGENGRFEMIGECFVYGIMNGEALREDGFNWKKVTMA